MKNLLSRDMPLEIRAVSDDKQTITLSFSSETDTVYRYNDRGELVPEILLHGPDNVDLTRLKIAGAVLFNHDKNRIIGPVLNPRIENKIGVCETRFDDTDEGLMAQKRVNSGSLRGTSTLYALNAIMDVKGGAEFQGIRGPAIVATRWTPYEVTLTSLPADTNVGANRDIFQRALESAEKTIIEGDNEMTADEVKALARAVVDEALSQRDAETKAKEEAAKPVDAPMTPETLRGLKDMAAAHSPEMVVRVAEMVLEGRTEDEIKAEIAKPKPDAVDNPGAGNPAERAAVTITAEQFAAAWKR